MEAESYCTREAITKPSHLELDLLRRVWQMWWRFPSPSPAERKRDANLFLSLSLFEEDDHPVSFFGTA